MSNRVTIPRSGEPLVDSKGIASPVWFTYLQDLWYSVRSKLNLKLGGVLSVDATNNQNSGSSETILTNYVLSKNTLQTNNDILKIKAWGIFAANANSKVIKLVFGGQTIYTSDANNANSGTWALEATIIRTGDNVQEIIACCLSNNTTLQNDSSYPVIRTSGAQDLTADLNIQCKATGGATGDIIQTALIIELTPYY